MIIGYVGTPGSGKSYDAVRRVLDKLRCGTKVYTNIEGLDNEKCQEYIKAYTGLDDYQLHTQLVCLSDEQMKRIGEIAEDRSLVVIDEVHKLFSNRNWNSPENTAFCEWASTHRHQKISVVLITQDLEKIDKHARSLIEWCFFYRKINFFGALVSNKYLRYTYSGSDHNGDPIAKKQLSYEKRVFGCYKSYDTDEGDEIEIEQPVNILRHPIFYAIPMAFALLLYFGSKSSLRTGDVFGTGKAMASLNTVKKKPVAAPHPQTAPGSSQQEPVSAPVCVSYKVTMPDGITALVNDLPPGASIVKCYGARHKRTSTPAREG